MPDNEYDIMAQAFRRLGTSEVTIVEAEDRLLSSEEPFAGVELADAFSDEGIEVVTGVALARAERVGSDGPVTGHLEDGRSIARSTSAPFAMTSAT